MGHEKSRRLWTRLTEQQTADFEDIADEKEMAVAELLRSLAVKEVRNWRDRKAAETQRNKEGV